MDLCGTSFHLCHQGGKTSYLRIDLHLLGVYMNSFVDGISFLLMLV